MKRHVDPENVKPCRHMETLVSAWVDGELTGVSKWYTERHVHDCRQCQASLPFLRGLRTRLTLLGDNAPDDEDQPRLPEARWTEVGAAFDRIDRQG